MLATPCKDDQNRDCLRSDCDRMLVFDTNINDLICCGHSMLRRRMSQSGVMLVTKDCADCFVTSMLQKTTGNSCHVEDSTQHCQLELFQDASCAGDLKDSKSTSGGMLCMFGTRTSVPLSWKCKKRKCLTAEQSLRSFRLMQDFGWMDYQHSNFWECAWKHGQLCAPGATPSINEMSLIELSVLSMFLQISPTVQTCPWCLS